MARYMRSYGKSYLKAPVVVGAGIAWHGPGTYLTSPASPNQQNRRAVHSRLRPPTVVTAPAGPFFGPKVVLNVMLPEARRTRVTRRSPDYELKPPVILATGGTVAVTLAPQSRRSGVADLKPPAVVTSAVTDVFYGPAITLAPSRRGKALPGLARPAVISQDLGRWGGVMVSLAPSRRPKTQYLLRNYVVAVAAVQIYYGPSINLTYSSRRQAKSTLRPPAILASNLPTQVTLAPQRRGTPTSFLKPPTVVFLAVEIYGPEQTLARIKPPPTISFLRPPTDVLDAQELALGPEIHLTYSRRGRPVYFLRPFTARAFEVQFGPQVTLAPQRRGVPKSRLEPPAVVAPVVSYGPSEWLTYSRRGEPTSFLKPPTVVASPPAYQQVLPPWLTYSRRGRPTYFLNPPTVVFPFFARPTAVSLAPQSRGRPTYFLTPPVVVRLAVEISGPETWITYSRRPVTKSRLFPPAVVGRAPFRGIQIDLARIRPRAVIAFRQSAVVREPFFARPIQVHLTRISPRPTVAFLKPPTVVRIAKADVLRIHLTYSRRGSTFYFRFPVIQGKPPFRPIQVYLTRITPRPTVSLIKPPAVVGAGVAFYGPQTWLVRIKHPPVYYNLPVVLVAFRRHGGDVCGFDIAVSFVCSLELPGSQVSGTDVAGSQVSGSSRAGTRIVSSESAGGSVSGSDRKAT